MLVGVGLYVLLFLFINAVIVAFALRHDFRPSDAGDPFVMLQRVATYADKRLAAAADSTNLPKPPALLADQYSLRVALISTLLSQVLIFTIVGIATKQDLGQLVRLLKLNRYHPLDVWLPAVVVIGAYLFVAFYITVARAVLPDVLVPQSTIPSEITRSDATLAIAAAVTVVGAPVTEELFFRGLVFGGLLKWGFLPAAATSALLFSLVHFDPGSVIPFFIIGVLMAWLFWWRGTLWDSVIFHFLFNVTSFALLAAS